MVEDFGLQQRQNGKQLNFGFGIYKGIFSMTRREEIEQAAMQVGGVHPDWGVKNGFIND